MTGVHSTLTRRRALAEAFDPTSNSMGFLRLLFAALVLLDHAFPLGGFHGGSDPMWGWTRGQESFGGLAVAGFFVLSGFLVTRSFVESRTMPNYLWKRFLRIFPGFWVCLGVTVLVFAPIAFAYQHGTLHGYVHGYPAESPAGYLGHNSMLAMNQYNIDNLLGSTPFAHSGYPQAFDGSLWTLIYEFKCYLAVAVLGIVGVYRFRHGRVGILALSIGLGTVQVVQAIKPGWLQGWPVLGDPQMMRLSFIFSLGMLLYLFRDRIPISDAVAAGAFVALVASTRTRLYPEIGLVALAYLCMWLAIRLPLHRVDRFGDFSYGLYIYAFPVEQLLALYGAYRWGLAAYVALSLVGSLAIAVASWFLVEKPCLSLKRLRLRAVLRRSAAIAHLGGRKHHGRSIALVPGQRADAPVAREVVGADLDPEAQVL